MSDEQVEALLRELIETRKREDAIRWDLDAAGIDLLAMDCGMRWERRGALPQADGDPGDDYAVERAGA